MKDDGDIFFTQNGYEYILYKNPDDSKPGLGTINYKDGGLYAGQIDNESFEPFGYGIYTLKDNYMCEGIFEKGGKGYGIITDPKYNEYYSKIPKQYTGELENFKPGGLGKKTIYDDYHREIIYAGRFTDGGNTLLGYSQKTKKISYSPIYYEQFQGTQTGTSVFSEMTLNGKGTRSFKRTDETGNDNKDDRYKWEWGDFENGKLKGLGVHRDGDSNNPNTFYVGDFINNYLDFSKAKHAHHDNVYTSDITDTGRKIKTIVRDIYDYSGHHDFKDAITKIRNTTFDEKEAEKKADIAKKISNATPRNVDMSKIGTTGVLKNKYNGTLKIGEKIHVLHPYGYGTIKFSDNNVFTGSYVDNNNMLGKESNNGKIGFFKINNNGDLKLEKDITDDVKEMVKVVVNKALKVEEEIKDAEKTEFNAKLDEVKTNINKFNDMTFTPLRENEGTIISANQSKYEGDKNEQGDAHGFGRMELKDGSNYEGQFDKGVAKGFGNYTFIAKPKKQEQVKWFFGLFNQEKKTTYTGEFNNGGPNGSVVIKYGSDNKYEGDIISFKSEEKVLICGFGFGALLRDGIQYIGEFKNTFSGLTHVVFEDKSMFDGWFVFTPQEILGFGKRTYTNGDVYKGFCVRGKPRGMGVYIEQNSGLTKWSKTFSGDAVPKDAVQNDVMATMIDEAIKDIMHETKLKDVQTKANEAATKAVEKAKKEVTNATDKATKAVEKAKKEVTNAANKATEAANKATEAVKQAKKEVAKDPQKAYAEAIDGATPKAPDDKNVTKINLDNGDNYVGHVKDDKPHGYGTMTYPNYCTYSGSFINDEFEGLGKIVYHEANTSPLKEYYGFVKGKTPHGYGLGVYKDGQKKEWHVNWVDMNNFKEDDDKNNPKLLDIIKKKIQEDAEKIVNMVPVFEEKQWGMKEYGLASAAIGLGAAGLYYAFSKSKGKSKSKKKRRSKSKSKTKRRSRSRSRSRSKRSE